MYKYLYINGEANQTLSKKFHSNFPIPNFKQIAVPAIAVVRNLHNSEFIQLLVDVLAIVKRNISLAGMAQSKIQK